MSLRQRIGSLDPMILGLTIVLTVVGLAVLLSATGPVAMQRTGDSLYYVKHQLLSGLLPGLLLFFFFGLIDYRRLQPLALLALIASICLLLLVYIPGIGLSQGGARSWVRIGPMQFQPSEPVKLTFLIYLSAWLARREREDVHDPQTGLLPFILALGSVMLLLVLQPNTGSMAIIVGTSLALYFLSGAPAAWFVGMTLLGAGLLTLLIKFSPYRSARFTTFLHPELDPKGIGYHINQALLAIGSGGWWGLGFGHSLQKFLYLPEVESDSIVAVFAEEMGFVVTLSLLAVFGLLIWRCFAIAKNSRDKFGAYLAAGIGSWLGLQLFMNVASMTGLMPMTGVTLPFISHGGSALTMLLAAMGLVAGVPRQQQRTSRF